MENSFLIVDKLNLINLKNTLKKTTTGRSYQIIIFLKNGADTFENKKDSKSYVILFGKQAMGNIIGLT